MELVSGFLLVLFINALPITVLALVLTTHAVAMRSRRWSSTRQAAWFLPPSLLAVFGRRGGPTTLALGLALVSVPIVAVTINAVQVPPVDGNYAQPHYLPLLDAGRWCGVLGAAVASALVAGTVGGRLARRFTALSAVVTLLLAWSVSIAAVPWLPFLLHQDVGFAYGCLDACSPAIEASKPADGLWLAVVPWSVELSPLWAPWPFVTLVAGVVVWSQLLIRARAWRGLADGGSACSNRPLAGR